MQIHYRVWAAARKSYTTTLRPRPQASIRSVPWSQRLAQGNDVTYRINRRAIVETKMPYTKGNWDQSEGRKSNARS